MLSNLQLKKILVVFTVTTMIFTLLMAFQRSSFVNAQVKMNFTGEEFYKGIIFGQGNVAKLLPEMWNEKTMKKVNSKEALELTDNITKEMKSINPAYFNELKQAINSKDFVKINEAFENGKALFKSAQSNLKLDIQKQTEAGTGNGLNASGVVSLSNAFVLQTTVITNAVLINAVYTNAISLSVVGALGAHSELEKEQVIEYISDQLAY
ncbi:hypothetical protein CN936_09570 [Bacillus cereus]|uniref:sporulation delaying protein family toxin n=1 Tax=Bacillus cereus TaxID=1396 RepID=UPI0007F17940|nr:sporulation delaying protein family toxin [Bacillus cereus]ANN35632.1 hypothetical protein A9498_30110 [Bacillus thuringiensis serovar coreanensis]PFR41707.1 hypothetical protein COK29_32135 [Bacillus cereus]PGL96639.1 hypothetical protein CN936_09570 [Bacillus cereus]